ncbi:glycosyltransferase family 2 protein [Actinokineospora globicatena]|uniref:Glycosyl transferase family 2 n=1 Tax=Actinokineospora globicatena TaxID=103729 RepID=A0A9W6V6U0_9PSEU|nr:glycosyltransferase family 2 protein [Actinokineospora globicatena]MCP2301112.1 Glycosyltransferase involved in cell wall bisynthesis [Actinokineospora globicatena]GLW77252.1 glycosyl transferase family 2 [Actinokineospora globicatena]GLW84086.1 glycosyl transferase family 2 [Actinokineospora globicatena]GLW91970.1 glycosyl transferase family 2 [Actinokineospora globicatena]
MPEVATRRILIVLPALNEEHNVGAVVRNVKENLPDVGILVVDDGSSDETSRRAREAGANVARLAVNLGVGGAMRTGFRYAVANGYDVVIQVDADGQHDPSHVPELVAGLDSADLVIGARFAGKGDYRATGPRRWAMWVLAFVISRLARTKLTDVTSGFKAAGPRAVKMFAQYYPAEYLGDTVESLVLAIRGGLVVKQVPVEMRERSGGQPSQTPIRAAVYLVRAGLALLLALVRRRPSVESADAA